MDGEQLAEVIRSADLEAAIVANELMLYFQPKIDITSGRLAGVEALLRWHHSRLGWIPPSIFVPIAESSNLIDLLSLWVLDTAIRQWVDWNGQGFATNIAINISAKNLERVDFPDIVDAACRERNVPTENLTIELTESATQGAIQLMDTMTRFRIKGLRISLDDFGTGYSSLVQLQQLPFSEMKIDKSFVTHADTSHDCRVITKSIIDLAHNLGLDVVAEGVETKPVLDLLLEYGCDKAQGYLFSPPISAEALIEWARMRR
jgi:EAL domain-containing protein (putative c-di-GMP-specific phosphodiesterase class I)